MLAVLKESRVKPPRVGKAHDSFSNCSLFQTDRINVAGPEKYWTYRWIHAVDGTSDHPFILELFSSSQPEIFNRICPSKWLKQPSSGSSAASLFTNFITFSTVTYLVCTQMRVCQVDGSLTYLTSSCETETFITGSHGRSQKCSITCVIRGSSKFLLFGFNRLPQRSAVREWSESEELHSVDQNSEG